MQLSILIAAAVLAPEVSALLRFSCSQLVTEPLDPLVDPGKAPSQHVHQIVGGNAFKPEMTGDVPSQASCTTCEFADDFSNYWTAVLYFRARNGTFERVPQMPNQGFEAADGGMTSYYTPSYNGQKVTAFQPPGTRTGETMEMPNRPCNYGIMANIRFPTCWDGKILGSPDHSSHVAYPESGTFESGGPCPTSHPVKISQLFYEVIWDTRQLNDPSIWPENGSQPFVWSYGDKTGYGNHGDYVFGWKGNALQVAMDTDCYIPCPQLRRQSFQTGNQCKVPRVTHEDIDGWLTELPGGMPVTGAPTKRETWEA
ncbi:hypothetical protein DL767_004160 [Monosporascus sp. MG133]|nr:hypothetical protein DL767_004160 [Monosporascus sp. MG133]